MWGYSLQIWQSVVFWLWTITAVGGGVAVAGSLLSALVSNSISEETQKQADTRVAQANTEAVKARSEAAQAAAVAALANEQTTKLEGELALAKLETARIQETVKWRTVSADSANILASQLQGLPFSITVKIQPSDPEAVAFGYVLHKVLQDIGVNVKQLTLTGEMFFFGVQLSGPNGEGLEKLKAAFFDAGIKLNVVTGDHYTLSVGSKLPEILVPQYQTIP